jgi:hypothetical protein
MAAWAVAAARRTEWAARAERAATPGEMSPKLGTVPERTVWVVMASMMHFSFISSGYNRFRTPL